ncbi:hypothetical protein C0J52_03591 [Blattella germanica]|nr:hypothetical protein C0J52_03591 [Blattella germanica]
MFPYDIFEWRLNNSDTFWCSSWTRPLSRQREVSIVPTNQPLLTSECVQLQTVPQRTFTSAKAASGSVFCAV